MKLSFLIPKLMDVAGNINNTKLYLKEIKESKNFESDIPAYLIQDNLDLDELLLYLHKMIPNSKNITNIELKEDIFIEVSLILEEHLHEETNGSETMYMTLRDLKYNDELVSVLTVKSNSLYNLLVDFRNQIENLYK